MREDLLKILEQGVAVWNEWRKNNPNVEIDLSNVQFSLLKLRDIDLKYSNLKNSSFLYSDLTGANLESDRCKECYSRT